MCLGSKKVKKHQFKLQCPILNLVIITCTFLLFTLLLSELTLLCAEKKMPTLALSFPIRMPLLICFFFFFSILLPFDWHFNSSFKNASLHCFFFHFICPFIPQDAHVSLGPQKCNTKPWTFPYTVIIFIIKPWFCDAPVLRLVMVSLAESLQIRAFLMLFWNTHCTAMCSATTQ